MMLIFILNISLLLMSGSSKLDLMLLLVCRSRCSLNLKDASVHWHCTTQLEAGQPDTFNDTKLCCAFSSYQQVQWFFFLLLFFFKPVEHFAQCLSKSSNEVISLTDRLVSLILSMCILTDLF